MSMKKSRDSIVLDELKNMFNQYESGIGKILNEQLSQVNINSNDNVVNLYNRKYYKKKVYS